jgi:uncharacterized protein
MRRVLVLSLSVAAFGLGGCASIARQVVLPGSYLKPPQCVVPASTEYELVNLHTQEGTRIMAQFGAALQKDGQPAAGRKSRPTVLLFYGNRMSIAGSQAVFRNLRRMGVNVLVPDYPGYGMSEGVASEGGCYAAADAAYDYLLHRDDVDRRRIVVGGLSLGSGPAVQLASEERVAGLILVVPFTNIRAVGHDSLPWYLQWAIPLLAPYAAFDNLAKIPRVSCPILLVEATNDRVTTAARSEQLAQAVTARLIRVRVEADHDGAWRKAQNDIESWLDSMVETDERSSNRSEARGHPANL